MSGKAATALTGLGTLFSVLISSSSDESELLLLLVSRRGSFKSALSGRISAASSLVGSGCSMEASYDLSLFCCTKDLIGFFSAFYLSAKLRRAY